MNLQYRMHPEIAYFPLDEFYKSKGIKINTFGTEKFYRQPFHAVLPSYMFYHVPQVKQN